MSFGDWLRQVFGANREPDPPPGPPIVTPRTTLGVDRTGLLAPGASGKRVLELRPRPIAYGVGAQIIGRGQVLRELDQLLQEHSLVELYGPRGMGKSVLAKHFGAILGKPDNAVVAYSSWHNRSADALAVQIVNAFYTPPLDVGTVEQLREHLEALEVTLLLDDAGVDAGELDRLRAALARCRVLLVSEDRPRYDGGTLLLRGLEHDDAVKFLEAVLGPETALPARAPELIRHLRGHPTRLRMAAIELRDRPGDDEFEAQVLRVPADELEQLVAEAQDEAAQRVLALLAFLDGAPVTVPAVEEITGVPQAGDVLERLRARGLVRTHSPTYGLAIDRRAVPVTSGDAQLSLLALQHFARWAVRAHPKELLGQADAALVAIARRGAEQPREALELALALEPALMRGGRWDAWKHVLEHIERSARVLGERSARARAKHQLGVRALALGDADGAVELLESAAALHADAEESALAACSREALSVAREEAAGEHRLLPAVVGEGPAPVVEEPFRLLGDQPHVEGPDPLGYDATASELAAVIRASSASTPLAVAIEGGAGMGKSTLLRRLEVKLASPDVLPVRINALSAANDVVGAFVSAVLARMDKNKVKGVLRERRLLKPLQSTFSAADTWRGLLTEPRGRTEILAVVTAAVEAWRSERRGRLLCLFIDDLDRCSEETISAALETVHVHLAVPGLVFVLAYDLDALREALAGSEKSAEQLARSIQTSHRIATPTPEAASELLDAYLAESHAGTLFDTAARQVAIERNGRNPRLIKRFVNSFVLEYRLDREWEQVGALGLARALLVQLYYPEFTRLFDQLGVGDPLQEFDDYAVAMEGADAEPDDDYEEERVTRVLAAYGLKYTASWPRELEQTVPEAFPRLAADREFRALATSLLDLPEWDLIRGKLARGRRARGGPAPQSAAAADPTALRGTEILWIDPDPDRNLELAGALGRAGAAVVFADDEDAAQARLRGRTQPFDLLITDVTEPGGPEAHSVELGRLRKRLDHRGPIVVYTPRVTPRLRREARDNELDITDSPDELVALVSGRARTGAAPGAAVAGATVAPAVQVSETSHSSAGQRAGRP